ncbi:MAG: hypothetical protein ACP5VE_08240 [Chthonomonadales bacterium]
MFFLPFARGGMFSSLTALTAAMTLALVCPARGQVPGSTPEDVHLGGYIIVPHRGAAERRYNAGYSMYVAVWPLLNYYPGHRFQTGLPGTWMFAQYDTAPPKHMYSDVEGGLGWWTDTRFATPTPKFIMGGVGPNFSEIANGPGHGWGTWEKPRGLYGVAQLSPWILFPVDGLNLKQGECGRLLGYGYLNLPLCDPKPKTEGTDIPTGGNCWTLFLNAGNFKGPVAFFLPHFWAHAAVREPRLAGLLLDSRPADPNRAVQMETQYIPARMAADATGEWYARIPPVSFPRNEHDASVLVQEDTVYDNTALYDAVAAWFAGGKPCSGAVNPQGAYRRVFGERGYATWQIYWREKDGTERKAPIAWELLGQFTELKPYTFGVRWNSGQATPSGCLVTLPQFYHLQKSRDGKQARWVPVPPDKVPPDTGLREIRWRQPADTTPEPYTTPADPASCWKKPGPVAGPFKARLGDGSVVTYYWYRFADQPALLNADLTPAERERLQARVVKLHRAWAKNRNYLPPPAAGKLADLDPALIVKPPKGLEAGYVPIVTRQELGR